MYQVLLTFWNWKIIILYIQNKRFVLNLVHLFVSHGISHHIPIKSDTTPKRVAEFEHKFLVSQKPRPYNF